jgi:hypothetical protein
MFKAYDLQILAESPLELVISDPPNVFFGSVLVSVGLLLFLTGLVGLKGKLHHVALVVGCIYIFAGVAQMTSRTTLVFSGKIAALRIYETLFWLDFKSRDIGLGELKTARVETIDFNHNLILELNSGKVLQVFNPQGGEGYYAVCDSINNFLLSQLGQKEKKDMFVNSWQGLKPGVSTTEDVIASLGLPDKEAHDITYGSTTGLHLMTYNEVTASVFLTKGKVVVIVTSAKDQSDFPNRLQKWEASLGRSSTELPSVAGKNHRIIVYSELGLTATTVGDKVELIAMLSA